jgi:hypothetical protein
MPPIRRFLSAIFRDWFARMSGPLTVPFTILALLFPSAAAKSLFAMLAVIAASVTSYRVWRSEYDRAEYLQGQLLKAEKQSPVTSADWKELSGKFEKIGLDVSAQWQCSRRNNQTIFENWNLSGTYQKPCESLCKFAGALLAKCPNVSLSESAAQQLDPAWRWLFFLKDNHNALDQGSGMPPIGDDGTIYLQGRIPNLAAVSARVCIECAALAL